MAIRNPNANEIIKDYDELQTAEMGVLDYKLNRKTPIDEYGWITEVLGGGWIRLTTRISKPEGSATSIATYPYIFELVPYVLVTPLYVTGFDVTYALEVKKNITTVFFSSELAQIYNIQVFGKSTIA